MDTIWKHSWKQGMLGLRYQTDHNKIHLKHCLSPVVFLKFIRSQDFSQNSLLLRRILRVVIGISFLSCASLSRFSRLARLARIPRIARSPWLARVPRITRSPRLSRVLLGASLLHCLALSGLAWLSWLSWFSRVLLGFSFFTIIARLSWFARVLLGISFSTVIARPFRFSPLSYVTFRFTWVFHIRVFRFI